MARLKVDHFPKSGKTSPNPHLPAITGHQKPSKAAGAHMPEEGARKVKAGQWNEGDSKGTPKADAKAQTNAAHSGDKAHARGNHPHHGHVPRDEHHTMGHREPRSHDEFHQLGNPKAGSTNVQAHQARRAQLRVLRFGDAHRGHGPAHAHSGLPHEIKLARCTCEAPALKSAEEFDNL